MKHQIISEAFVTIELRNHLIENGWDILAFDFPQSGTGIAIRPKDSSQKVKGNIIPDIVAQKDDYGVFFENKERFHLGDFKKIEILRTTDLYSRSLSELFGGSIPKNMWYGIGIPHIDYQIEKSLSHRNMIDLLVTVSREKEVSVLYSNPSFNF